MIKIGLMILIRKLKVRTGNCLRSKVILYLLFFTNLLSAQNKSILDSLKFLFEAPSNETIKSYGLSDVIINHKLDSVYASSFQVDYDYLRNFLLRNKTQLLNEHIDAILNLILKYQEKYNKDWSRDKSGWFSHETNSTRVHEALVSLYYFKIINERYGDPEIIFKFIIYYDHLSICNYKKVENSYFNNKNLTFDSIIYVVRNTIPKLKSYPYQNVADPKFLYLLTFNKVENYVLNSMYNFRHTNSDSVCEYNYLSNDIFRSIMSDLLAPYKYIYSEKYKIKTINGIKEGRDFYIHWVALANQIEKEDINFINWLIDTSIIIDGNDPGGIEVLLRNMKNVDFYTQYLGDKLLRNKNKDNRTQVIYLNLLKNLNSPAVKDYYYDYIDKVKSKKLKEIAKSNLREFYLYRPKLYNSNEPLELFRKK